MKKRDVLLHTFLNRRVPQTHEKRTGSVMTLDSLGHPGIVKNGDGERASVQLEVGVEAKREGRAVLHSSPAYGALRRTTEQLMEESRR